MKHILKITASLMAAAMSFSVLGTAAGAVDFDTLNTDNTSSETTASSGNNAVSSSAVQNAIPEFFDGCIKFTWSKVNDAVNYAVKICNPDGTVVTTYYVSSKYTAVVVPETVFDVDHNSSKDFYACVIALKPRETDVATKTFYAPISSKLTVKSDMSGYPEYGAAQNVAFFVKDGKLLIGWQNPNDFAETKDIFSVSVCDRAGKTVFSKSITDCHTEVSGLKDGETYTVKIYNKTFSAMSTTEYKFVSDTAAKVPEQGSSTTAQGTASKEKLPAPSGIKVTPGNSCLTISWKSVDEADAYRIYIYDAKTRKYKAYKTVKGTKYTIKNLSNGKAYKFKVAALRYDNDTKKYVAGKTSKALSGTPKKSQNK